MSVIKVVAIVLGVVAGIILLCGAIAFVAYLYAKGMSSKG